MMLKFLTSILAIALAHSAHAFQCYFTLVKDNCWKNYNVTVEMRNAKTDKVITSILVPQGQAWSRQKFACDPAEILAYRATFNPTFWDKDENKSYPGQNYWSLPKVINAGEAAWNITVCYAHSFSGVPLPPDATGQCQCDFKSIPAVEVE